MSFWGLVPFWGGGSLVLLLADTVMQPTEG